jgi:hypothetical protein
MLDRVLILRSMAAAAVVAALALVLSGWPRRRPRSGRLSAGGALGVGAGFFLGVWPLELAPHWPPSEDQHRLLLVLLPAVVCVEVAACVLQRIAWLAWSLRFVVAAGAARVLLHDSTHITGSADPATREWPPEQTVLVLGGLAAALLANWALLDQLATRGTNRAVLFSLAIVAIGAGVTIMLSGYASGGQLGFPLGAAMAGVVVASFVFVGDPDLRGPIGVGVVGVFALLIAGRFFGSLTTTNAVLLFAAPLLGWLPEIGLVRRIGPRLRSLARVALTAAPVAVVLTLAPQKYNAVSSRPAAAPAAIEPTADDYANFK